MTSIAWLWAANGDRRGGGPRLGGKYRRWLAPAWAALGEEAGTAAWAEGQAMTQEEALAYALEGERGDSSSRAEPAPQRPGSRV